MQFIKNIRIKIGQYLLNNKLKKTKRQLHMSNLKHAKYIGIVFNNMSDNDFSLVKSLENEYKAQQKKVEILGFCNDKNTYTNAIGDLKHCYTNLKGFNWFFQPKATEINEFINKKFDILINLYPENEFPVDYIIQASKASFKVGSLQMNQEIHDMIIDNSKKMNDTKYLSDQINYYLNMIETN